MHKFKLPVELAIGPGCTRVLSQISGKRILIFCDRFLANSTNLTEIQLALDTNNQVKVFSDVNPDPSVIDVAHGIVQLSQFVPDLIIAYGGGSAIDLTKAVKFFGNKVGLPVEKFIAIPTTSGTGSEVTNASVISIPDKQIKVPLCSDDLLPDLALLDPKLTLTVPAEVTANTGIDVLTHAIEALVSSNSNDFSDALAEKAITLVFAHLSLAYSDGNNIEARSKHHNASSIAGIAFKHAGLGMVHAIAHQLGAQFHVPHGLANAIALIPVIKFNMRCSETLRKYAYLSRKLGFSACEEPDANCVNKLIDEIERLYEKVGIESNCRKYTFSHTSTDNLTKMVNNALSDITLKTNPIVPDSSELQDVITKVIKLR